MTIDQERPEDEITGTEQVAKAFDGLLRKRAATKFSFTPGDPRAIECGHKGQEPIRQRRLLNERLKTLRVKK